MDLMAHVYVAYGTRYDITAYQSLAEFLDDVWNDAFVQWDGRVSTEAAVGFATRAQDRAEIFWKSYHDEPMPAWIYGPGDTTERYRERRGGL